MTSIEERAFSDCSSLTAITLPEGVTSIGNDAFSGCSHLTAITIPESLTSIGVGAFYKCSSLTAITIPESVTSIGNMAFWHCESFTAITLPEGVTSIGEGTFSDCISLTSITIPEGVTSIGGWAFESCTSLTTITIPESVTSIGNAAFYECSSLTAINIPEGVTSIGKNTFNGCTSLTSITIPEGVTSIGEYAFSGCTRLASIYMKRYDPVSITSDVFYGVDRNTCTLYVPSASLEKYRLSSTWGEFKNLLAWYKVAYIVDGEEIAHQWLSVGDEISVPTLEGYEGYSFSSQAWEGMISKPINIADNADAMLYTNAPCTNTKYGDQFVGWHVLFDDNANTFFHSEYSDNVDSADGLEHYLRVDMGEGKSLNKFSFSYTVRGNQAWCTPQVIVVEGSNDADGEYDEIAILTDLPKDKGARYYSEILGNGTSYRYIRYRVIETTGNEKVMGKIYFYIAEFGMTEVQQLEIEEKTHMPDYDVMVNGCFVKNKYMVYYFVGAKLVHSVEVAYGEEIPNYIYEPTGKDEVFAGWQGDVYDTMPAHDVTYEAKIESVETDIHTSELETQGSQVIYDLMGRRVEHTTKGIYIVNGKKTIVK